MPAEQISAELARADALFQQREAVAKLREARQIAAALRNADHRSFEVEWKFAKYSWFLGQQLSDEEERTKVFEQGRDAGLIASAIAPDRPDGYFWYGANLGELARMSPVTVGYGSVDKIEAAMDRVIELDPGYQGASAFDVLALIELNTRLFGGEASKAASLLEKALEYEKNNSTLRLHLAQAYLDLNKLDAARAQLDYIVKMRPDPEYEIEHRAALEQARRLLATRLR
ncbi:MAG: TRAP transporter TatT component family protein [Pyrinomonadaceae bacterium]